MNETGIQLRPINSLLTGSNGGPAQYWIPAYQRGYRWKPLQVTQLLDDIWEFIQHSESKESFYCLQPLVIRERREGEYEVVDGQQRLTTIYILLTYLADLVNVLGKSRYQIHFETRGESNEAFLTNIDIERANENVDFFHISEAWNAIDNWFSDRDSSHKLTLLQHLLNDDVVGRNVKVIWFELHSRDDPVAAFTRLNVGKIPLTNDELIRAQILRKAMNEDEGHGLALRIAHEWDQIEKALQRDPFWYFLSNEAPPNHNRIGLLFELVAQAKLSDSQKQDPYGVFHFFTQQLEQEPAERLWLSVKQTFMALEEWYEDRELFHVVGFLIFHEVQVSELLITASDQRKSAFVNELLRRVFDLAIGGTMNASDEPALRSTIQERCESISYSSPDVRKLLLLFNLASLMENPRSNLRFQFDSIKKEKWDIEHVRSVDAKKPVRRNEQIHWLTLCSGYLSTQKNCDDLVREIKGFSESQREDVDGYQFDQLYNKLLKHFHEHEEGGEDGLQNLTLLDTHTNRSYKNAVFAVKRKRILELDQSGIFVPLCTRNVFLKCYSPHVDNVMFWGAEDAADYLEAIVKTLSKFFSKSNEMAT